MKFTLSWLKDHLDTGCSVAQVVEAMTMAGLEVEHVTDPAMKLAPFTVAKIAAAKTVAAATAVTALCRVVHFLSRTTGPARRARIGSSARNRLRSSAICWAVA